MPINGNSNIKDIQKLDFIAVTKLDGYEKIIKMLNENGIGSDQIIDFTEVKLEA